jgi:toxin-antitoxin system PIN domain toxin
MLLLDVNVLIGAFRDDAVDHQRHREFVDHVINGDETFGSSDHVLASFLRIVTHPSIFDPSSALEQALAFAESMRGAPNCTIVAPGERHWEIFSRLCKDSQVRGNLVPDAYLAALAIESGSEWITMDGDFARFAGLRWRRPFS